MPRNPWSPSTAVYNPRAVVPHVASLRQACAHCGRFSTAAIRRCPGSVSVPVVGAALSRPLVVFGTVGRYPAVYLVTRRPLRGRNRTLCLSPSRGRIARYYRQFPAAIPVPRAGRRRLTTPFAAARDSEESVAARLACLIHATSVHSEPGSNPSSDWYPQTRRRVVGLGGVASKMLDPPRCSLAPHTGGRRRPPRSRHPALLHEEVSPKGDVWPGGPVGVRPRSSKLSGLMLCQARRPPAGDAARTHQNEFSKNGAGSRVTRSPAVGPPSGVVSRGRGSPVAAVGPVRGRGMVATPVRAATLPPRTFRGFAGAGSGVSSFIPALAGRGDGGPSAWGGGAVRVRCGG